MTLSKKADLNSQNGNYVISNFGDGIYKINYSFPGYHKNENITHAVTALPVEDNLIHNNDRQNDTSYINDEINVIGTGIRCNKNPYFHLRNIFSDEKEKGFLFTLTAGEKIFGGGSKALPLNRRGHAFPMVNNPWYGYSYGANNLNFSVPFFMSSRGYAIFFDNGSKGHIDIGKTDKQIMKVGFSSGEINFYLILGEDYKHLLSKFNYLTGTQPLPPKWVFGNFMSRFGYTSQEQTDEILQAMLAENIPVSAIVFDLFWFGDTIKETLGNLEWVNKNAWPDPKKMIRNYTKQDIKTVLIAEPFVLESSLNHSTLLPYVATDQYEQPFVLHEFYFGAGSIIDIFRKDAQDKIWEIFYEVQLRNGVTGWWTDLGEPENHPPELYHNLQDEGIDRLMAADEVHNLYAHYWSKMLFEKYETHLPNQRLFHLTRSGFAGSQRYSIFPWSGDVTRSWAGLKAQLPIMLGMSICGIPYIHADAGGFAAGDGENDLFIRWLQFAAFTPIFRPHGTALYDLDPSTFSYPSEAALYPDPYKSIARKLIRKRYSMLPYNYTLAYLQTSKGAPLVAPLFYYYPDEEKSYDNEDEFLWGEHILVSPVLIKKQKAKTIFLPGKLSWYLIDSSVSFKTSVHIKLNLETIPVFVKAGSIIPETGKVDAGSDLKLSYYFSNDDSSGLFYEDDGNSANSIVAGAYYRTEIQVIHAQNEIKFIFHSLGDGYKGAPLYRNVELVLYGLPKSITSVSGEGENILLSSKGSVKLKLGRSFTEISLKF